MVKRNGDIEFTNDPNNADDKRPVDWDEVDILDKEGKEIWEIYKKQGGITDDGKPYPPIKD